MSDMQVTLGYSYKKAFEPPMSSEVEKLLYILCQTA